MYVGAIIKETITDDRLFDHVEVERVELWKTDTEIPYWTMVFFQSQVPDFPERTSRVLRDGWFADMKQDNTKYIIFKDCVYGYTIGNIDEKNRVLDQLRKRGIPETQFGWEE